MRDGNEIVCRVQTYLGIETPYILCAPVLPRSKWGALTPKLHIPIHLDGVPHIIIISQLVAIPGAQIGSVVGDAPAWRDEIVATIDLLVSGFQPTFTDRGWTFTCRSSGKRFTGSFSDPPYSIGWPDKNGR